MSLQVRRSVRIARYVVCLVVVGAGLSGLWLFEGQKLPAAGPSISAAVGKGSAAGQLPDFSEVAKQLKPAVVNIKAVKHVYPTKSGGTPSAPGIPDLLRRFFDGDLPRGFHFNFPENGLPAEGVGSGFVIAKDGYILTNNHVVKDADEISVTLWNNKEYKGKVVGRDERSDLAVLKIDAKDLTPATFGDSDAAQVGEWVLAIGSPFGLSKSVTAGIISAKGRNHVGITDYEDFLQTDADINPGNSGGPLVNMKGEVIGVNTAIFSRSGGSQGIGFAIPAKLAQTVMESLVKHGTVTRGYLGVNIQDLTEDLAKSFGSPGTEGVLIADVRAGSPADKAGLQAGDIITKLDGKPAGDVTHLRNTVAGMHPGKAASMEIVREGKAMDVSVAVGELPSTEATEASPNVPAPASKFGMALEELTPSVAEQMGLEFKSGLVVTSVAPGEAAELSGLRAGDVIVAAAGKPVKTLSDFHAALKSHHKDGILLQVFSEGTRHFVFLKEKA